MYSIARDDHDIDRLIQFFAEDGVFDLRGRCATGHEELRQFYLGTMNMYWVSNHITHAHVIEVNGDQASGIVTGHAELAYQGTLVIAAYRYTDAYVRDRQRWTFARRTIRYQYAVPVDQLANAFTDEMRIRWPGAEPEAADIPEGTPTFPIGATR